MKNKQQYGAAVIGGGPAGMMAAISAAQHGAKVVLIEKNKSLGKKLLLTGGGRCNFSNMKSDLRELVACYGENGLFLFHALAEFGPKEAMEFFNDLGVETKIENNGRMFPQSDSAQEILDALMRRAAELDIEIIYGAKVVGIEKENGLIKKIILENGENIVAKNYIIATGGKSYPQTGCTGDGHKWAAELGHKIDEPFTALAPIKINKPAIKNLAGIGLKNVGISVSQRNKKVIFARGELLFTHFGVSGPAVLNISGDIGKLLKNGPAEISLDFLPDSDFEKLEKEILENFQNNPNREIKNCLADFVCAASARFLADIAQVDSQKTANNITKKERRRLALAVKDLKLDIGGVLPVESGMVAGGGINIGEIDHKTMRSKIIVNLYFAGEIINAHGPTGGFNLLQCWSTGRLAGISAAKH